MTRLQADLDAILLSSAGLLVAAGILLGVWRRLRSVML